MSRRSPIIQDEFSTDPELEPLIPSDPACPDRPAPFDFLTENVSYTETLTSRERKKRKRMVCECQFDPEQDDPEDACGENCLNRLLMIECGSRCPCGEYCTNKRFQRAAYSQVEVFRTEKKGWGLRTLTDVPQGAFVMEYCGEVISPTQFEDRKKQYTVEKRRHYYFMSLRSDEILDATQKGNLSRFINHSCDPNCETQKWTVQGKLRIGFFSVREIVEGEEVTFDYQFQRFGDVAQRCYCGSVKCRGYLGQSKQSTPLRIAATRSMRDIGSPRGERRRHTMRAEDDEDSLFEKQVYDIVGSGWRLRNTDQVISISRIMLQAESVGQRVMLLQVLQATEDQTCLRKFLSLHGLRLLWSWMVDSPEPHSLTVLQFREQLLQALAHLPISTRNQLTDSHLLTMVTRWLKPTTKPQDRVARKTDPPQPPEKACPATDQQQQQQLQEAQSQEQGQQQQTGGEGSMEGTVVTVTEADSNMDSEAAKVEEEEGSCDSGGVVRPQSCDLIATESSTKSRDLTADSCDVTLESSRPAINPSCEPDRMSHDHEAAGEEMDIQREVGVASEAKQETKGVCDSKQEMGVVKDVLVNEVGSLNKPPTEVQRSPELPAEAMKTAATEPQSTKIAVCKSESESHDVSMDAVPRDEVMPMSCDSVAKVPGPLTDADSTAVEQSHDQAGVLYNVAQQTLGPAQSEETSESSNAAELEGVIEDQSHDTEMGSGLHDTEMGSHDAEMASNDTERMLHESALQSHDSAMMSCDPTLQSRDTAIMSCDPTLQSHDSTMRSQDSTMRSHDTAMVSQDSTMRSHDTAMVSQDSTMRSQDSTMMSQDSTMRSQDSTMMSQDSTMRSQDSTMMSQSTDSNSPEARVVSPDSETRSHDNQAVLLSPELKTRIIEADSATAKSPEYQPTKSHDVKAVSHDSTVMPYDSEATVLEIGTKQEVPHDNPEMRLSHGQDEEKTHERATDSRDADSGVPGIAGEASQITSTDSAVNREAQPSSESHENRVMSFDSSDKTHDSEAQSHDSEAKSHDSEAKSHESEAKSHDSEAMMSRDSEARTRDSEAKSHESEAKSHDSEAKSHDNEARTRDSEAKSHESEAKSHDSEKRSGDSEARSQESESKSESSDSQSCEEGEAMSCEAEAKETGGVAQEELAAAGARVVTMATELLEKWEGLKEVFRIPKRAKPEKRPATNQRLDSPLSFDIVMEGGGKGGDEGERSRAGEEWRGGGHGGGEDGRVRTPKVGGRRGEGKGSERKRRWDHWNKTPPPPDPPVAWQQPSDAPPSWPSKRKVLLPKPTNIFPPSTSTSTVTPPHNPTPTPTPSQSAPITTSSTSTTPSQRPYFVPHNTAASYISLTGFPTPPVPVQNTVIVQQGGQGVYVQQQVYQDGCRTTIMPTHYLPPSQPFMVPPPTLQPPPHSTAPQLQPQFQATLTSHSLTQAPPTITPAHPVLAQPLPTLPTLPPGFIRPIFSQPPPQMLVAHHPSQGTVPPSPLPPPPPTESGLPFNWRTAKDLQGKTYYYHIITRKSQWSRPTDRDADGSVTMDLDSSDEEDSSQAESLRAPHTPDGTPPPLTVATDKHYDTESTDVTLSPCLSSPSRPPPLTPPLLPHPHSRQHSHSPHRSFLPSPHTPPVLLPPPSTPPLSTAERHTHAPSQRTSPPHAVTSLPSPRASPLPGPSTPPISPPPHSSSSSPPPLSPSSSSSSITPTPFTLSPVTHTSPESHPPPEKRAKIMKRRQHKLKEAFKHKVSRVVTQCLDQHRKPDCKYGRITCSDDFKYLARRLTHGLAEKELHRRGNAENLVFSDGVKSKVKEYIRQYMKKCGPIYVRI